MADSNSPDRSPKQGKPEPGKGAFDFYKPPTEPPRQLAEPDANYNPDKPEKESQGDRFRAAAILCAGLENDISNLLRKNPHIPFIPGTHISSIGSAIRFDSNIESLTPSEVDMQYNRNTSITFFDGLTSFHMKEEVKELGVRTDRALAVGFHTDMPTLKAYQEYLQQNPNGDASTVYYFDEEGRYGKISIMPQGVKVDPDRQTFAGRNPRSSLEVVYYESEMTSEDFELAGLALASLKKRITDPDWDKRSEDQEKPAE